MKVMALNSINHPDLAQTIWENLAKTELKFLILQLTPTAIGKEAKNQNPKACAG